MTRPMFTEVSFVMVGQMNYGPLYQWAAICPPDIKISTACLFLHVAFIILCFVSLYSSFIVNSSSSLYNRSLQTQHRLSVIINVVQ